MEHYLCRPIVELPAYMQDKFIVPQGEIISAGQIYVAETLATGFKQKNLDVFEPTLIEDVGEQIPSIVINNGFEMIPDGRRPSGQPDYTQYYYTEGEVITAIKLLPETKFEISYDSIIVENEVSIGGYLIPEDGGSRLLYVDSLNGNQPRIYLLVEGFKFFRLGGQSGEQFAKSLVVRVKQGVSVGASGLNIIAKITDGLETNLAANTKIAELDTKGGTAPYSYHFATGGQDNHLFNLKNGTITNKEVITEARIYHLAVTSIDNEGKEKGSMIDVLIDYPSIKSISVTMTDDIREQEEATQYGGLIAVASVNGGTAPYELHLTGKDARRFSVDLMSIKTGVTPLTRGKYNITINAIDSKGKMFSYDLAVNVKEPYPEIDSVTIKPEEGLVAPIAANTIVGNIQVLGGTPPYTITLPDNINDNDLFIIDTAIKAKADIITPGDKIIKIHVVDKHKKTKDSLGTIKMAAPDITEVRLLQTVGLREDETNTLKNALVGTLSVVGGTEPIYYNVEGTNKDLFQISGSNLRVKADKLTKGKYNISVKANDNYNKSASKDFEIDILEAYPKITNVKVNVATNIREGETSASANYTVATMTSEGGTAPYTYEISGVDASKFTIDENNIKIKNDLTAGTYNVIVKAIDSHNKTKETPVQIIVAEAYIPITEVRVYPVAGLTAPVSANAKIADIVTTGGREPITYSLPAGVSNNASFLIEGNTVVAKEEIATKGSYGVVVKATDKDGQSKNSVTTAFNIN